MRTIYTASKTVHAPKWRALRAAGYSVNSTWIDEAGPGESADLVDLARRCIDEAKAADSLLLYCEPGEVLKGALIEAGAALAAGKVVRQVGTCVNDLSALSSHPLWKRYDTLGEALAAHANGL